MIQMADDEDIDFVYKAIKHIHLLHKVASSASLWATELGKNMLILIKDIKPMMLINQIKSNQK